jgi:hypothetical protein
MSTKAELQARIAELEAEVERLQAELAVNGAQPGVIPPREPASYHWHNQWPYPEVWSNVDVKLRLT